MQEDTNTTQCNSPLWVPPQWGGMSAPADRGELAIERESPFVSNNLLHLPDVRLPYNPSFKDRAREMRKNMTLAEKIMWKEILPGISQYRFLRQRPIHHYIVDFYCPKLRLVIEVDGETHNSEEAQKYDQERTEILHHYGIEVLRYSNEDVILHTQRVKHLLQEKLDKYW